ncbi:hypothetical protein Leryth_025024 [Lithospermum erythrorhizon]|nr:hypothetical protein Leryth_025024 [Lithospermum erythrorhizon]
MGVDLIDSLLSLVTSSFFFYGFFFFFVNFWIDRKKVEVKCGNFA